MTDARDTDRTLPHEAGHERQARLRLAHLLTNSPVPPEELPDNLALYLRRQPVTDLLAIDALYRMILDVPGVIMEFGVHRGRHLAALTALRGIHEAYSPHRRIVGFDTFAGFPEVTDVDAINPAAVPGRFAVAADYPQHLRDVLDAHEDCEPLRHIRRTLLIQGDVRDTPQTIVALAYFDLDLYEPTRDALQAILPHLTRGSVLAFDELGHAKWPGETAALREVLGSAQSLNILPGLGTPAYLRWDSH
jgi:hypothetical protein